MNSNYRKSFTVSFQLSMKLSLEEVTMADRGTPAVQSVATCDETQTVSRKTEKNAQPSVTSTPEQNESQLIIEQKNMRNILTENEKALALTSKRVTILKRQPTPPSLDGQTSVVPSRRIRTLEEREAAYAEARLRILGPDAESDVQNDSGADGSQVVNGCSTVPSSTTNTVTVGCSTATKPSGVTRPASSSFSGVPNAVTAGCSSVTRPVAPSFAGVTRPASSSFPGVTNPVAACSSGFSGVVISTAPNFLSVAAPVQQSWPNIMVPHNPSIVYPGHLFPYQYSTPLGFCNSIVDNSRPWLRNQIMTQVIVNPNSGAQIFFRDPLQHSAGWRR